jgi:hypothetical protein
VRLPIQNLQWNRQKQQTHRNWNLQSRRPETIKTETGYHKALLVRDPDGRAVRLMEK